MRYIKPQTTTKTATIRRTVKMLTKLGQTVTSATIRSNGEKAESYPLNALKGRIMHEIHSSNANRADYYREEDGSVTMIVNCNLTIKMTFDERASK